MDGYAPAYVAHNVPLLVVSGLGSPRQHKTRTESPGTRIVSEVPVVETEDALTLLHHLKERDATELPWHGKEHNGRNKFKIKAIGRDYTLPPRIAQLHAPSARPLDSRDVSPIPRPIAHSPLSPLTPEATVYPDGLLDPKWAEKHNDLVPSAYLSFYKFTSDPTLSTLQDNQLKTDVNSIKSKIAQSGYKTRLVVALLSEGSIIKSPDLEERLANIRRATGLDSKTSLFFLPPRSSPVELEAFVETIVSTIYPLCIEYYRDLSKHSRRKRNRGVIPPPTSMPTSGTLQTLSNQGWNVRYDFKLGVFAEFRQEMDAAIRSYESGYETLLGPDVMEAIASWNPRWNEARLLADVFAIRILRCLLWNGNTTGALRRWRMHRDRVRDFVDRRGKGSSTYGWEAWEARWATVMAEIIQKASIFDISADDPPLYLPPEKSIAIGERLEPWEYLHHPGYWFQLASKHLVNRRTLALSIPEEDRHAPSSSSPSQVASRASSYDTYLCPEPYEENPLPGSKGVDHALLIVASLTKAITEFQKRKQYRLVSELSLLSAKESMKREDWDAAVRILRPLWQKMSFRREGWWSAVEEISWALRKAAAHVGDGGTVVSVDWELLNKCFVYHSNWHYDLARSLDGLETVKNKPVVVLHHQDVLSFLSAKYVFEHSDGKVGELCSSQLAVTSDALTASVPIVVSEIKLEFEGSMKPIILTHSDGIEGSEEDGRVKLIRVPLTDMVSEIKYTPRSGPHQNGRPTLVGTADLTFRPNQTKVFEFTSLLREAGEANAVSATFSIASALFDLDFIQAFEKKAHPYVWWGERSIKRKLIRDKPSSITILPKPPKVELRFVELQEQYYTNENIKLHLEIVNGEDVDSIVGLDVKLLGDGAPPTTLRLIPTSDNDPEKPHEDIAPSGFSIGKIATTASVFTEIHIPPIDIPALYNLTVQASYRLVSDMETPVSKSMAIQLAVINPFEANYDFSPRLHPDPWPSFFSHDEPETIETTSGSARAHGLSQKWCLTSRYFSFAAEDLIVEDLDIQVINTNGGIQCLTKKLTVIPEGGVRVLPKSLEEAEFDVYTQKISLDDRGTATLDVSLAIRWRRDEEGSPMNTTILAVPRLLVSSSEPRVIAAVSYSVTIPSMIHFDVTIENPSNHFLTFGLAMEPSEKFAFSGMKQSTLQLVPLSRRTVRFRLVPFIRGDWIGPIRCVIKDRYFQKILKIAPTEGMKADKEGILLFVPEEEL